MLTLKMFKYDAEDRKALQAKFPEIRQALDAKCRPLLWPSLAAIAELFHVPPNRLRANISRGLPYYELPSDALDGEVYLAGDTLICLSLIDKVSSNSLLGERQRKGSGARLELFFISRTWSPACENEILKDLEKILGSKLTSFIFKSNRFDEIKQEGATTAAESSPEELAAVKVLADKELRVLATAVKTSGGLLIRDLPKQFASMQRHGNELVQLLKDAKLVDSEIVVVCAKSQAQVARVPSKDVIERMASYGMKCACGRKISDERIEEALSVTELARSMLDKARWMTVLLVELLGRLGVPRSSILVEQNLGGDEIDCIANISGELVLFELKDKEFSLGNAYSFGAKVAIVKPKHRVIVSTEHVGGDAREHFNRQKQAERRESQRFIASGRNDQESEDITYIEGLTELESKLTELADSIYKQDAVNVLSKLLPLGVVGAAPLLKAFESSQAANGSSEKTEQKPVPESPAELTDPAR